jgi:hypothetical protein
MLRAYLEEPVAPESTRTMTPGRWVAETTYPSPDIEPKSLHLRPDGGLGEPPRDRREFSIRSPQSHGQAAGEWMGAGCAGEHPTDQRLDDGGALVFETPATQVFEMGRFDERTMAFPPGVTIKDYTWNGSAGYLNPKRGGKPDRFPSIIQIVPAGPGQPR